MKPLTCDPLADPGPLVDRVYAYVAYRLGDGAEAEDVLGDVFERAVRYREAYDASKGKPITWLIGIARRCIAESLAARPPAVGEPTDAPAPGDIEEEAALRLTLAAAVAQLDERSRELIALRFGADLTAAQIAALTGLREENVRVVLHRALRHLRPLLESKLYSSGESEAAGTL